MTDATASGASRTRRRRDIEAALRAAAAGAATPRDGAYAPGAGAQPGGRRRPRMARRDPQPARAGRAATTRRARSCARSSRAARRSTPRSTIADRGRPGAGRARRCCASGSCSTSARATSTQLDTIVDPLVVTDIATVMWSPHGHPEAVDALLAPVAGGAGRLGQRARRRARRVTRARELAEEAYVVDLAWLRSTPWRERVAADVRPAAVARRAAAGSTSVTVRHHPESAVAGRAVLRLAGVAAGLGARARWCPRTARCTAARTGAGRTCALRAGARPARCRCRAWRASTIETAARDEHLARSRGPAG